MDGLTAICTTTRRTTNEEYLWGSQEHNQTRDFHGLHLSQKVTPDEAYRNDQMPHKVIEGPGLDPLGRSYSQLAELM